MVNNNPLLQQDYDGAFATNHYQGQSHLTGAQTNGFYSEEAFPSLGGANNGANPVANV